jgi:hypothetical protein
VQHERIGIGTKLSSHEWDAMRHRPADEMDVARETVKLCDQNRTLCLAGLCQRRSQLWPAIERVGTLAGFDLDMLGDDLNPLGFCEALDSRSLGLDACNRRLRWSLRPFPIPVAHISY